MKRIRLPLRHLSSLAFIGVIVASNFPASGLSATWTDTAVSSAATSLPDQWSGTISYIGHRDLFLSQTLHITADIQATLSLAGPTQAVSPGVPADGATVSLQATWSGTASWHLHDDYVTSGCRLVRDETYSTGVGGVAPDAWSIFLNAPSSASAPYTYDFGESNGVGQRVTATGTTTETPEPGTNPNACAQPTSYTLPEFVVIPAVFFSDVHGVLPNSGVITGQITSSDATDGSTGSLMWNISSASTTGGPVAVPGGPYSTTRARSTTLNASASHDTITGAKISNYQWNWTPGPNCGADTVLASDHETTASPRLTITPLCDLNLTLTVTDDAGRTNSASTLLAVDRRTRNFKTTPVKYTNYAGSDPRTPTDPPTVLQLSTNVGFVGADNVVADPCLNPGGYDPKAFAGPDDPAIFCPYAPAGQSHKDNGYVLGRVSDRSADGQKGPFDGYSYITATSLQVSTWGLINPYLLPGGPVPAGAKIDFYAFNEQRHVPVKALLKAISQHEGLGTTANPLAGHTGAMAQAVKTSNGNIVAQLEPLFDANADTLTKSADVLVDKVQKYVNECSLDPRPVISSFTPYFWNPLTTRWEKVNLTVGDSHYTKLGNCS